jgi:hypothetical protein
MRLLIMAEWDPRKHADELDELRRRFPGWQVWAVPHGNPTTHVVWCARPQPLINADSAEELAAQIRAAHEQPPHGSPSLASLRSYTARAKQLRDFEEAAAAEWEGRKAEQAAREVTVTADPVERFYQRHGYPGDREVQVTTPGAAAATEDDEPGTA